MILRNTRDGANGRLRRFCKKTPHEIRVVFMISNQQMRMIAEDSACPADITALLNDPIKCFPDRSAHRLIVPEHRMIQKSLSLFVEFAKFFARRLNVLTTVVDLPKLLQLIFSDLG